MHPLAHQDRSDEEELDSFHDPYAPTRGRVSPSPYTANTERARQFNVCKIRVKLSVWYTLEVSLED